MSEDNSNRDQRESNFLHDNSDDDDNQHIDSHIPSTHKIRKPRKQGNKKYDKKIENQLKKNMHLKNKVDQLLLLLDECVKKDQKSRERGKPALEKLRSVDTVKELLLNKQVKVAFLDSEGLKYLVRWIEKSKTGQACPPDIKRNVLSIIVQLPVEKDHLTKSVQIFDQIKRLKKSKFKDIQDLACKIMSKWEKILSFNAGQSFEDYELQIKKAQSRPVRKTFTDEDL